jgi:hypothetical protein
MKKIEFEKNNEIILLKNRFELFQRYQEIKAHHHFFIFGNMESMVELFDMD